MKETLNDFIAIVEKIRPGAYTKIKYAKQLETNDPNDTLIKVSEGVYRLGIKFSNIIENKDREIQPLRWGENVKGFEKYFIQHTKKNDPTQELKYYLKIFTTKHHRTKTTYILNNEIVSKQFLIDNGKIKEKESKPLLTFSIPLNEIIEIGY